LKKLTKKKKQKVYYKNLWNGWWPERVLPWWLGSLPNNSVAKRSLND
jgi:hypothetical protein